jgi:outer membrane protein TolC
MNIYSSWSKAIQLGIALALGFIVLTPMRALSLEITPQVVIDRVLKAGLEARQIRLKEELARSSPEYAPILSVYDTSLDVSSNYTASKPESLTPSTVDQQKDFSLEVVGSQPLPSGTTLGLKYQRDSQHREQNAFADNFGSRPDSETLDTLTVEMKQDLWNNAFGSGDRNAIKATTERLENATGQKLEELEELIVESLGKFWETYVAKDELKHRIEARDRYKKLVTTVRNKSRLGFTNPGELAQAQAELENQEQKVKASSHEYLTLLEDLLRRLQWDIDLANQVELRVPTEVLPSPKWSETPLEKLRPLQISQREVKAREWDHKALHTQLAPNLSLTGSAAYSGLDERPAKANAKIFNFDHATYFVGLQFSHALDSKGRDIQLQNAKVKVEEAKTNLQLLKQKLRNEILSQKRLVNSLYLVAQSAVRSEKFRNTAVREQERAYRQGRTDINILIQVFNALFETQIQKVRAVGDYHIALNQLAALYDELIKVDEPSREVGSKKSEVTP